MGNLKEMEDFIWRCLTVKNSVGVTHRGDDGVMENLINFDIFATFII